MQSIVERRGEVAFPEHRFERVYMQAFFQRDGLPEHLERWQETVDDMLFGIVTEQPIYIMIDQGIVTPDKTHRRKGMHIDGYWMPDIQAHGGGGGRHSTDPYPPSHYVPRHCTQAFQWPVEGLLLASNVEACVALSGEFTGEIGEGGDCSHLDLSALTQHKLQAGICYAGNVTMLHESITTDRPYLRTLVRMNLPGWEPTIH